MSDPDPRSLPMDENLIPFFCRYIYEQCGTAQRAWQTFNERMHTEAPESPPPAPPTRPAYDSTLTPVEMLAQLETEKRERRESNRARSAARDRVMADWEDWKWEPLQSLATAVGNVSKALWGDRNKSWIEKARTPLREALGISEPSPIKSLRVRNQFEHFDEVLDRWFKKSRDHNTADKNITSGPPPTSGVQRDDQLRTYYTETGVLTFGSQRVNLTEVMATIAPLREEAAARMRHRPIPNTGGGGQPQSSAD